ncbi:MAG: hypothetical protein ABF859_12990 [Gluconobacter sp.]
MKRPGFLGVEEWLARLSGLGNQPDAKTVWLFRERLTQAGAIDGLFNCFDATLRNAGYLPMSGHILDATLVVDPKQRKTNAEKADLRAGRIPECWQDKPSKLSYRDRHALDAEVCESKTAGRWEHADNRSCSP